MAITPITPIIPLEPMIRPANISGSERSQTSGNTFADLLRSMVNNVNTTNAVTKNDAFNLSVGLTDMQDLHNIEINAIRADLALRTLTSVRNSVLEAYTEIMRITI
jgi:flagellar hook-basal body complex protein FliE